MPSLKYGCIALLNSIFVSNIIVAAALFKYIFDLQHVSGTEIH